MEQNKPGSKQLNDMQKAYFYDLLNDLFNFYSLEQAYKRLLRMMDEEFYKLYPKLLAEYKELAPHLKEKVVEVSNRFRNQYTRLLTRMKIMPEMRSYSKGFIPVLLISVKHCFLFGCCLTRPVCLLIIKSCGNN